MTSLDSFQVLQKTLKVGNQDLRLLQPRGGPKKDGLQGNFPAWPVSLKVLLENLLRNEDGRTVTKEDLQGVRGRGSKNQDPRSVRLRSGRRRVADARLHRRAGGGSISPPCATP